MSSARSFVIVLMAFDPLYHEVHTPTYQFNLLKFILECGGAGNLGMLAAKTRLQVTFPMESETTSYCSTFVVIWVGEGCGPCQHPPGGYKLKSV